MIGSTKNQPGQPSTPKPSGTSEKSPASGTQAAPAKAATPGTSAPKAPVDAFSGAGSNQVKTLTAPPAQSVHINNKSFSLGGLFGSIEKDVSGAVGKVEGELKQLGGAVEGELKQLGGAVEGDVKKVEGELGNVLKEAGGDVEHALATIGFGTNRPEMDRFVQDTADFRDTLNTLQNLPPSDPRYAQAAQHLQQAYGYTPDNAPKPGTLWVSPRLSGGELPGDQVTASHFPVGTPVTTTPDPMSAVFAYGHIPTFTTADGKEITVHSPEEYKALVAANRAAAGITNPDGSPASGDPKAVHLTMEGGGGLGKRYAASLQEMFSLGIVPASVSGTSVGAIAAGYIAAGADPKTFQQLSTDPALTKFFDIGGGSSGLAKGDFMYHYVDQKLRDLTGIKDRPVTFADLKIPLQIPATVMTDTNPPPGKEDLTKLENREFVFSQQTTPNTPVVYAMLASGAFPGPLPTVDLVDPTTGRKLILTDSGVLDLLPMKLSQDNLPVVGMSLVYPHVNSPNDPANNEVQKPLPAGSVDTSNPFIHALNAYLMSKESASSTTLFHERTDPQPNQFMLGLPIFDLADARKTDRSLVFPYNPDVDPRIDQQSRDVTRQFFQKTFNDIGDPNAKYTNLTTALPKDLSFNTSFDMDGKQYTASYSGGDALHFTDQDGSAFDVNLGRTKIEGLYLDNAAFGDLNGELKQVLDDHFNPIHNIEDNLPF